LPSGGHHPGGMLVGGGFGSGKSHLLEHLAHLAMNDGFVVSKVTISKETPLYDPAKVFRAAVESAIVPGKQGSALPEVAASLPTVSRRALALQRFRFWSRLMRAAGYAGWVLLFDEVELIGRYSVLQRAKSYAELARWVRGNYNDPGVPLAALLAITDDFEAAVLAAKNDPDMVPARLRSRQSPEYDLLAGQAEVGMRIIDRELVPIKPPDDAELDRTYGRLKEIHGDAFDWDPPDVSGLERLAATRMRQSVRAWIN